MRYDPAKREIALKIAYYGPGMSGKTTNLAWLHDSVAPDRRSEIVALDANSERILQFEFLALEVGQVQGNNVRLQIATIPGQSYYSATRRKVLEGADGVVFVIDSRREALDENIDSMNEFYGHLRQLGMSDQLPVVLQYNKQDLPTALTRDKLQPLLNHRSHPSYLSVASTGDGVAETCEALVQMIVERIGSAELPRITETLSRNAPQSWLVTCHRCQSMLDIPQAEVGKVFTCGVCRSPIEIVDVERGVTQAPPGTTGVHRRSSGASPLPMPSTGASPAAATAMPTSARGLPYPIPRTAAPDDLSPIEDHTSKDSALRRLGDPPSGGSPVIAGGMTLDGFTVVQALDTSPQGQRFRVREISTGALYRAIDLSPALAAMPEYQQALDLSARRMSVFSHDQVLGLRSLKRVAGRTVLLADDALEHEPLTVVLSRRRALAPPHAMEILRQVALALQAAAAQGLTHGWLRPDVILVNPDGQVKVDEFYVPTAARFLTRDLAGDSAATEYYLAPEYLSEDVRNDPRSDMFMLGAILFKMLTGDGLVTGYNAHEALHKVVANGPRGLRDAQPGISRELDGFYKRLIALDPAQRFASHDALIDQLDRFGGGAKRQSMQLTMNVQKGGGSFYDGGQMVGLGGAVAGPGVPRGATPASGSRTVAVGAPRSGGVGVGAPSVGAGTAPASATLGVGAPASGLGVGAPSSGLGVAGAARGGLAPAAPTSGGTRRVSAPAEAPRPATKPPSSASSSGGGGGILGFLIVLLVIGAVVAGAIWWFQQQAAAAGSASAPTVNPNPTK